MLKNVINKFKNFLFDFLKTTLDMNLQIKNGTYY